MKLIKSPLELLDFFVLKAIYEFIEPEEIGPVNTKDLTDSYNLDLDFSIQDGKDNQILIFCKISINDIDDPIVGYKMFIDSVSVYKINDAVITEKEKHDLIGISGLSIAINNLRTYIVNSTSNYPLGKYLLPAIDLNELLRAKHDAESSPND